MNQLNELFQMDCGRLDVWMYEPTAEQRADGRQGLALFNSKVDYLKNPRYAEPGWKPGDSKTMLNTQTARRKKKPKDVGIKPSVDCGW